MLVSLGIIISFAVTAAAFEYAIINGLQCMKSEFIETHNEARSDLDCAILCDDRTRCQAFSKSAGPCQLFMFDRCSKNVRDCSCSRTTKVFVKQQPGLPPGALCPAGYADDLCGTKYKFHNKSTDWDAFRSAMDSESGLVIMADVTNETEMAHLKGVFASRKLDKVFLGGLRLSGTSDPSAGWMWIGCNASIAEFWSPGEPNNSGGTECVTVAGNPYPALIDGDRSWPSMDGAISECVSPFD